MYMFYNLDPKQLPTEMQVWRMGKQMERAGYKVGPKIMNALASGDIRYSNGEVLRFCRGCVDYKPLEHFSSNQRYVFNVNYECNACVARRKRIQKYGEVRMISDSSCKLDIHQNAKVKLNEENKRILNKLMEE